MERKAVTEEPLPYANYWEWCSDDQPHPSQWSDKGVAKNSVPLQSEHGRGRPPRSNGGSCCWREAIS